MQRRVVVTGMGMITPVGGDVESSWRSLCEGRGGVGPITLFDASTFATRIAGEVAGFRLGDYRADAARWVEYSRTSQFALAAATLAVTHAGIGDAAIDPTRFGVYLGSGEGQQDFNRFVELVHSSSAEGHFNPAKFTSYGIERLQLISEADQEHGGPAGYLAAVFNARGPNSTCQTACAASAQAIGEATELIRRGDADVMLAGGTHSMVHPLGLTGFILLTAMSTRNEDYATASRPFDRNRDGFVLGEGGGMLVLEELEHAKARGATIYGEIAGHCSTADAFRLTDSHDQGRGAIAAMRGAMTDAGVDASEIGYINAHGTSTPSNDSIETLSIKRVFGDDAYRVPISSTKSMTGHLVSAGGAVEAIACLLAIRDGVLPPTINLENQDPECDLDYLPRQAREQEVDVVLSNSFGFGGQNTALIVRRFTD
ncbi:beta-ketoacyl-[acyl-carrier-protein] synthase family protein [Singulisphaera acidiphila]|uniref:3-oxoacyl-[acyl-carrier-protein] synthase 2 n=1 Tax=Singulisphaera acidiphila (strain ATCC BAA-1392 / DSM 18658 / VKM B-2454 / MOB10) TaxID=886293 RepID=L0DB36_SINAD|nr:beta-ketoacyl-[acyl-carrier-protein] synthase family protein [Singulisphaera acidiphila]AGA26058.1 3-oxoacyl-(acyl-carrier-protein) synthase [Singulisphaera acidiphila DSM 18658]